MDPKSHFALRVALQTLKERCISLQRRLVFVEEDNHQLRERLDDISPIQTGKSGATENLQLRFQVAELERQKAQLSEHINMVSTENRKLWSRLSQLAKEQENTKDDGRNEGEISPRSSRCGANQNLIRSKTFTQHSPNPNLRHKLINSEQQQVDDMMNDISLEEVALEAYDDGGIVAGEDYAETSEAELGFAYLNVDDTNASSSFTSATEADFNYEMKKCIDGLQEMRLETLKQQQELSTALSTLETRRDLQPCPDCIKKTNKPEMADKSLETDESLSDAKYYNDGQEITPNGHYQKQNEPLNVSTTTPHLNIIQEKIEADAKDKMCPMCGKVFSSLVSFDSFKGHVEMHFIDESNDIDTSIERNFEFISHAVGDF